MTESKFGIKNNQILKILVYGSNKLSLKILKKNKNE